MNSDLRLLHHGLDAIIQRAPERMPPAITAEARLERYALAVMAFPDRHERLRREIGQRLKRAWARGVRLNLVQLAKGKRRFLPVLVP